ncbi:XdhC family protein [Hespellia stercorisuis]|uniref:Xanthine dehydrogenase accessory factor n=1 Tax=Hespellia stercorisuis DSM 15480 TaxID=1121950 RepID=A0A1M6UDP6_9FIRM|nr:XdhC/CoxI family protein [Hespellia stercorisuis]SHK67344.1 xanthine dehydrogenase accessory factor [Hespellia stercorisuis DSM 15480]
MQSKTDYSELYRKIKERDPYSTHVLLTVVNGPSSGEKIYLTQGKIDWSQTPGGFLEQHLEQLRDVRATGEIRVEEQDVFAECIGSEKELVICGGGHVSVPIVQMGQMLGFRVTVIEDRPKFADNIRRLGEINIACNSFDHALEDIEGNENTFFVIVTRGHRYDQLCLRKIIQKPNAYIGMIGSRKRVAMVKEILEEEGIDRGKLEQVYTPIGLKIGAETPEEIAVSVMAEIIQVKNQVKRYSRYTDALLSHLTEEEQQSVPKVMATIVSRKGSAPRGIGTKMLVFAAGETVDSIGGGCAEANVIQKARLMLREETEAVRLCRVDMTGKDAEEDGMVCGGVIEVLLEKM